MGRQENGPLLTSSTSRSSSPPTSWAPPSTVKTGFDALAQHTGADEIMIATIMHGYQDRLRSYELIADACLPRNSEQVGNTSAGSTSTAGFVGELRNR